MKTKNIFKALAAAMLMPAMLLTTACSNEDDALNTENTAKKGYILPVTVNVTRQGNGGTTRASYNETSKKLEFSAGDKLFVEGVDYGGAGQFAGTLNYVSEGTFSGTIYTQEEWTGTADALFSAANDIYATLLPNGYESYNFLSIIDKGTSEKYDDVAVASLDKAFVASETAKANGVEQFSFEKASNYSSGFALAPQFAILNFTISGLEAGAKDVTLYVTLTDGPNITVTGSVTPNASGVATFAVGVPGGFNIKDISNNLTVGSHNFTLPSTALAAGHIYNITRSAAPAAATGHALSASAVGEVVGTDGMAYDVADKDNLPTGVTAAGMVAYKSGSNGLVIALADEASTMNWSTANGASGAAAHTPAVTGQTWKLPSQDEWRQMFSANGGNEGSCSGLNTAITNAGGTALEDYDEYWSSTEHNSGFNAYYVSLVSGNAYWGIEEEDYYYLVRACLAF